MAPAGPTLLEEFVRHLSLERGLAHNTCLAYASDLGEFLKWLRRRDPLRVSPALLDDYLWHLKSEKHLKPTSIFRKMEALRAFYRFQAAEERVAEDPTRNFKSPHLPERLPKFLTLDEIETLLGARDRGDFRMVRAKTMLELLYATGMRASELLSLRPEYVNLQDGWVRVLGKGAKERMIPVHARAGETLARYLRARGARFKDRIVDPQVFLNRSGKALSRVQLWRDLRTLGRQAGLSRALYPHLVRHTFASHLLQGGADVRSLQEMLGHASLTTTQIYTHLDRSGLKRKHKEHHPRG
ncbi:MAG: tyrosine recombinase [Elusimicrobiota bacterium]